MKRVIHESGKCVWRTREKWNFWSKAKGTEKKYLICIKKNMLQKSSKSQTKRYGSKWIGDKNKTKIWIKNRKIYFCMCLILTLYSSNSVAICMKITFDYHSISFTLTNEIIPTRWIYRSFAYWTTSNMLKIVLFLLVFIRDIFFKMASTFFLHVQCVWYSNTFVFFCRFFFLLFVLILFVRRHLLCWLSSAFREIALKLRAN